MNKRKLGSFALFAMLLALCVTAEAQQPKTIFRIGYLSSFDPVTDPRIEGIRQSLREFGYIEGQNITIEYRNSEGKVDPFAAFAAEMLRLQVDIIVVSAGNPQIRAVMNTTKTIPIVMAGQGSDPVAAGLIDSLARPGGALRPSRPVRQWVFHQAQTGIDISAGRAIWLGHRKGRLKFLFMAGCASSNRARTRIRDVRLHVC